MTTNVIPDALRQSILEQARAGAAPESLVAPLLAAGWTADAAVVAVEQAMHEFLAGHAREHGLPVPVRVPAPLAFNGPGCLDIDGRQVRVLAQLLLPRVIVLGDFLGADECAELVDLARGELRRSNVVDPLSGGDQVHPARTSAGMSFARQANPLVARIERRIAGLLGWPEEHGEGLQILQYRPGEEYRPHYDYFNPADPGTPTALARGGQRVATMILYLNTPEGGGSTTFPDASFEVAAQRGGAVFFSYDRPHPMTRTLHAGSPVTAGEKWIATKWLRETRCT